MKYHVSDETGSRTLCGVEYVDGPSGPERKKEWGGAISVLPRDNENVTPTSRIVCKRCMARL